MYTAGVVAGQKHNSRSDFGQCAPRELGVGAFSTRAWGLHAIWVPAGLLAVTLILFVIDEREGTASK